MAGVKHLRKIQLGKEGTAGTAVPATTILRAQGTIEDARTVVFPEETVGYLGGTDRQYVPSLLGIIEMEGEATYEQLPWVLSASLFAATAAQDGAGTDYIWDYVAPTTALNTIDTFTVEGGDNQEAERIEYGYVSEFTLSGKYQEAWMVSATWQGRQVALNAFTATATLPTVEEMLFGRTKLYIDDTTGTIGTSLKSNTLLSAELKVTSGWIPKFTADGELYYSFLQNVGDEITLDITFEHDATSAAEKVLWRAGTPRQIRLSVTGTSAATAGTTYTYKTLLIDLAGKWEKFEKIDEIDGNDVVTGTFRCRYNSTANLKCHIVVVNEVTAFPA